MTSTQHIIETTELAAAIHGVADIVQGIINRRGATREEKGPISQRIILHACLGLDPAAFFALDRWEAAWRSTRRDGTRDRYKALIDAVHDTLVEKLPGDWRTGGRYTPDQLHDAADALINTGG